MMPERLEFAYPYVLTSHGEGERQWFMLSAHGNGVASYSVATWGSPERCIEAAWKHAYDPQDAIAEAEARGYARGCRDIINKVAKWHNDVPSTGELIAGGLRYWLAERTENGASQPGHTNNATAE